MSRKNFLCKQNEDLFRRSNLREDGGIFMLSAALRMNFQISVQGNSLIREDTAVQLCVGSSIPRT